MTRPSPNRTPDSPSRKAPDPVERWIIVSCFLGFGGLIALDILSNFAPAKLGFVFLFFFWLPLIGIHEAGHALVASALGWRVRRVVIGYGPILCRLRIGSTPVEIRWLAIEGFVSTHPLANPSGANPSGDDPSASPRSLWGTRLQHASVYAAGVATEIALALGVIAIAGAAIFEPTEAIALIAAQSLLLGVAISAALNLIPHTGPDGTANDGLGIAWSLTGRFDSGFDVTLEDVSDHLARGDIDPAQVLLADPEENSLEADLLRAMASAFDGDTDSGLAILEPHGNPETLPPDQRAGIHTTRAIIALHTRVPDRLQEARARLTREVKAFPTWTTAPAVLAAVNIELGHLEAGARAIDHLMRHHSLDSMALNIAQAYRGLALHLSGHTTQALELLGRVDPTVSPLHTQCGYWTQKVRRRISDGTRGGSDTQVGRQTVS